MLEISDGIRRVTLPLPWRLGHVHCYLLRAADGWIVVDTGLGSPDARERWAKALSALDGPVVRIVVTHSHPDHVGGAGFLAELTGAQVCQSEVDYAHCERVWGSPDWHVGLAPWYATHGVPSALAAEMIEQSLAVSAHVGFARGPKLLRPGDRIEAAGEAWEAAAMPGHADGQLVLFGTRTRRLLAGDHLLAEITPVVGLFPEARPDPLADYLASLQRTVALAPSLALSGHRDPIADPAGRAREIQEHHARRLEATRAALAGAPRTAYAVSAALFGEDLTIHERRFALSESLAHLERLRREGVVERVAEDGVVSWRLARAAAKDRR